MYFDKGIACDDQIYMQNGLPYFLKDAWEEILIDNFYRTIAHKHLLLN